MQKISLWELQFWSKSKHKAWEGSLSWKYKFFTSSDTQSKFLDLFDFEWPALIFGTWWKASVHYCEEKFAISTDCYCLKTNDTNIFLKYIYIYLRGNMYLLEEWFKWAGLEHISKEYLKQIQIPLPSLATQRTIAAKLDKLQSLIDLKKQAITKTDDLTKSIFLEMFGDPMTNEKWWESVKLEDILEDKKNLSYGIVQPWNETEGGIKVLRPVDIIDNVLYLDDVKSVSKNIEDKYKKTRLNWGEILLVVRWATWWVVIAPKECKDFNVTRGLAVIKTKWINNVYLCKYFQSQEAQNFIQEHTRWATLKQINLGDLRIMDIPLPPLSLQQKFADIITKLEKTKEKNKQSLAKLEDLYHSEMQRSFSM